MRLRPVCALLRQSVSLQRQSPLRSFQAILTCCVAREPVYYECGASWSKQEVEQVFGCSRMMLSGIHLTNVDGIFDNAFAQASVTCREFPTTSMTRSSSDLMPSAIFYSFYIT